jgi:DNA-directed RNA polymerase subunit omega
VARITVEDCLENEQNRFELILRASKRARQLALTNSEPLVPADNDKPTVIALREIAKGLVNETFFKEQELAKERAEERRLLESAQPQVQEVTTTISAASQHIASGGRPLLDSHSTANFEATNVSAPVFQTSQPPTTTFSLQAQKHAIIANQPTTTLSVMANKAQNKPELDANEDKSDNEEDNSND